MATISSLLLFALLATAYSAPQFITFKEGKLGVNFGGYHAGVGLGGLLGGGTAGGLFAEAGTPHGQAARAGLGGAVDSNGQTAGGLYAGATAGGNVGAAAGLAGGVSGANTAGVGYAGAQAGDSAASAGLGGDTSAAGSGGFTFSGAKSFGFNSGVAKEFAVQPVQTVEVVKPVHNYVETNVNIEAENEVKPVVPVQTTKVVETVREVQPVTVIKEVYVPQPVFEKHITHVHRRIKPHHFRKTAYIGGYVGGLEQPPPVPVVYKTVAVPAIEKRVDVVAESSANANAGVAVQGGGVGHVGYTKQVAFQSNPTFFADIFNIPIQTLRAVGNFLGNSAGNTNISVQKTASVYADADGSTKHVPSSSSSSVTTTDTKVSVNTSPAAKIIDDIFAIPINTLGAVNKFLENNVPARKRVQVNVDSEDAPTRVRLGPHARRRASKQKVIIVEQAQNKDAAEEN